MVDLIMITACYSEKIAKIIKGKLPDAMVIAINKNLPVRDDAATKFAKDFYDKLLQGKSPLDSFNSAKKCLRVCFRTLACCCQHKITHEADCEMHEKIMRNKSIYFKKLRNDSLALKLALCDACFVHDALAKECDHGTLH